MYVQIDRIMSKLDEVRRRRLTCFGADSHQFRLNNPLPDSVLLEFEKQHHVRLPDDYREFLLRGGNGGAGPFYGILPLERWNDAVMETLPDYLSRPCPLRPDMPTDVSWEKTLSCPWQELFQGTLALVHQGCSYYGLLVVTGTNRGRVVYVNLEGIGSPYFVLDKGFLPWYERWLDELLWGYDISWFGTGLPGKEEDMVAAFHGVDATPDLCAEALSTLMRISKLRGDTMSGVQGLLRHPAAKVRSLAATLIGKHGVTDAMHDLEMLTCDPESEVRKSSIESLAKMPGVNWEPIARRALHDECEPVVLRAMCLLKDAKLLRRSDIENMLQSDNHKIRSNALWAANAVVEGSGKVAISDNQLFDPSKEVRRYAILAATHDNMPSLLRLLQTETELDLLSCLLGVFGRLGDVSAVPEIIHLTKHSDGFVRQDAARTLGKLRDPRSIPSLRQLLADQTIPERRNEDGLGGMRSGHSVAETARQALANIEAPHFFGWIRGFFK